MTTWNVGYDAAGSPLDYTTIGLAIASGSVGDGDTLALWYADTTKGLDWRFGARNWTKALEVYGALGRIVTLIHTGTQTMSSTGAAYLFRDLTFIQSAGAAIYLNNASVVATVRNCRVAGSNAFYCDDGTLNVYNCEGVGGFGTFCYCDGANATLTAYNNTVYGYLTGFNNVLGTVTATNNVTRSCGTEYTGTIGGSNNAGEKGQAPATGRIDLNAITPKFLYDIWPGKSVDHRVAVGSDLIGAGVDVGLTIDIDGNAVASTFPVGCSNGAADLVYVLTTATPAGTFDEAARNTDPGIANVRIDTTYKIQNVDLTGTLDPDVGAPSVPTITAADDGTGTSATITISGSDSDTTNTVYYRKTTASAWSNGGSRSEDGGKQVTGLTAGAYYFYVASASLAGSTSASAPVVLLVTNGADNDVANIADAIATKLNTDLLPTAYASRAYYVRKALDQHDTKAAYVLPAEDGFLSSTAGMQARQTDLSFMVVWFYRATTDSTIDAVVKEVLDAEQGMRNHTSNGYRCISGSIDTVIDAEMYNETRCYRAQLRLTYRAVE